VERLPPSNAGDDEMTDKELLELTAKAAGIERSDFGWAVPGFGIGSWDPLENDGDSLRLAVKLEIDYTIRNGATWVNWPVNETGMCVHHEVHGNDPYAATRRAITRAAAEIGKEMK
jgi:hypothetical protein